MGHVSSFMDFDEREMRRSNSMDSSSSSGHPSPKSSLFSKSGGAYAGRHATSSKSPGSSSSAQLFQSPGAGSVDSIARRRKMVADCKGMRAQVSSVPTRYWQ